ncbi:hypothetical protein BC834DRAFT_889176 [Gloeopeniophorella convolvens]|nr:hypothetical protein BC834DRAFT_889176 [Gloeopeniophorella convolvens]
MEDVHITALQGQRRRAIKHAWRLEEILLRQKSEPETTQGRLWSLKRRQSKVVELDRRFVEYVREHWRRVAEEELLSLTVRRRKVAELGLQIRNQLSAQKRWAGDVAQALAAKKMQLRGLEDQRRRVVNHRKRLKKRRRQNANEEALKPLEDLRRKLAKLTLCIDGSLREERVRVLELEKLSTRGEMLLGAVRDQRRRAATHAQRLEERLRQETEKRDDVLKMQAEEDEQICISPAGLSCMTDPWVGEDEPWSPEPEEQPREDVALYARDINWVERQPRQDIEQASWRESLSTGVDAREREERAVTREEVTRQPVGEHALEIDEDSKPTKGTESRGVEQQVQQSLEDARHIREDITGTQGEPDIMKGKGGKRLKKRKVELEEVEDECEQTKPRGRRQDEHYQIILEEIHDDVERTPSRSTSPGVYARTPPSSTTLPSTDLDDFGDGPTEFPDDLDSFSDVSSIFSDKTVRSVSSWKERTMQSSFISKEIRERRTQKEGYRRT